MARALAVLRESAAATAGLVAPRECPCGADGTRLCPRCADLLRARPVQVDGSCDALQVLESARLRAGPAGPAGVDHRSLLPVLALGAYEEGLQDLVLAWKNGGCAHLVGPIATGLAPAVEEIGRRAGLPRPWLLPAPSRLAARLRRGEDHVLELARALERLGHGRALHLGAAPDRGQGGHGARDRRQRRIRLRDRPGPRRDVILLDDVVTTGATLRGLHEALTGAGHRVHGAVVIASARIPEPPSRLCTS